MREVYLRSYVGILLAAALVLAASWAYWHHGMTFEVSLAIGTIVLACLVLLGDVFPLRVSDKTAIGVWDVGLVLAVVMLGPDWAAIVAIPSALYVGWRDWLRTAYEIGHSITIVYLAGIAFSFASYTPLLLGSSTPAAQIVYGTLATGLTLLAANRLIAAVLLRIKYDRGWHETWREDVQPYMFSDILNILTAGLGALALAVFGPVAGPVAALVLLGGAISSQVLVYRSREQVKTNEELRTRIDSLERAFATSNNTFGTMIIGELGRKDGYTHRHAAATSVYAADLAREMKLDDIRVEKLRMAGLLHNVGLFGLPEDLLLMTDRPNSIAQSRLAEHPARGGETLAAVPEFREMASWVRWHHERPDGRGYPDKLRGPWIPVEAKVLAVAQAYAALVLDGPSRPGVSPVEAREKLGAGADTEFDGVVVRALLRILDTESEGYRMADDHRFIFPAAGGGRGATPDTPPGREGYGARTLGAEHSQG